MVFCGQPVDKYIILLVHLEIPVYNFRGYPVNEWGKVNDFSKTTESYQIFSPTCPQDVNNHTSRKWL